MTSCHSTLVAMAPPLDSATCHRAAAQERMHFLMELVSLSIFRPKAHKADTAVRTRSGASSSLFD
jgi:hypothetical protein